MTISQNRSSVFTILLIIMGSMVMLFIVSPLLGMLLRTSGYDLFEAASDKEVQASIIRTLVLSFFTTLAFSFLAIPFAYLLARKDFYGKRLINAIIDLPIVIPHSAAGIALLGLGTLLVILGVSAAGAFTPGVVVLDLALLLLAASLVLYALVPDA